RHYIWDFDGMLFDSYPHTARALYKTLLDFGRAAPDEGELYRSLRVSVGHAFREFDLTEEMRVRFREYEAMLSEPPVTVPYPGIPELLEKIWKAGGENYLLTNRDGLAGVYLEKYGMAGFFREIVDSTYGFPSKPDPASMLYLKEKYGFRGDALMLGDRELDAVAGVRGGADALFFDEFYRVEKDGTAARYIVHTVKELEELIFGEKEREA
ncbi:MAG: HAD hydrolase-like protein, partial [Clostridia bacterium]|nr:HAD hydrolase-like protein [Clostridia bacterium]